VEGIDKARYSYYSYSDHDGYMDRPETISETTPAPALYEDEEDDSATKIIEEKDWNAEFQVLHSLHFTAHDFVYAAKLYGKIIW
jgi:hypothetical protein